MNKVFAGLVVMVGSLALVACEGGPSGSDDAPAGQTASALDLVQQCDATLDCFYDGEASGATLTRDSSGCHMGALTLADDGSVVSDDVEGFHWLSTPASVSLCAADGCMVCGPRSGSAATTTSTKKAQCTGAARSCSSYGPGTCSPHDGCSLSQHLHILPGGGTDFDYDCDGVPKSCDRYSDQHGCEEQDGCEWK